MLFNSFYFLVFYPIVTIVYFILAQRFRWAWLLAASCYFYMFFKPVYILILAGTIVIDYFVGIGLEKTQGTKRKRLLVLSIIANTGILMVFKYYNFFAGNVNYLLHWMGVGNKLLFLNILLPIGLSFHTFQAMSYTIEVYRGNRPAEKHFGIYALYVMFYPQLVAGPIERPQNILFQFHEERKFSEKNLSWGLKLMLWGLFKKVFVADRLATYVNAAFSDYKNQTGSTLLLAAFFFSIQIYCDFSGYTDIARGAAKTMGYDLVLNFKRPYLAANITDFWRRWHISLSSWFKDYVYFPLGGNRTTTAKWFRNVMVVFLLSGIWHGANWTFVIWGFLHGIFTVIQKFFARYKNKQSQGFKNFLNLFNFNPAWVVLNFMLVTFAWIFFRAESLQSGWGIIERIFSGNLGTLFTKSIPYMLLSLTGIFIVLAVDVAEEYNVNIQLLNSKFFAVRFITIVAIVTAILMFGIFQSTSFIYFQF